MPFLHVSERVARARSAVHSWGSFAWLVDAGQAHGTELSLARMEVGPGRRTDAHRHGNCDEAITMLSGCVTVIVDGVETMMWPGDVCWVGRGSAHCFRNDGEVNAVMLIAFSSGAREVEAA